MRKSIIGLAALLLGSPPAFALDLYNEAGTLVAEHAGIDSATNADLVIMTLNGIKHLVAVGADGPVVNVLLYFSQPGCNGTPMAAYNPAINLLPKATWDGQTAWPLQLSTASIYLIASVKDTNGCRNLSARTGVYAAGAVPSGLPFTTLKVPQVGQPNYSPP